MAKEGDRGFIGNTLRKTEVIDWVGMGIGIVIAQPEIIVFSAAALVAKKELGKKLDKKG